MDFQEEETSFNYTFQVFLGGCRFWDPINEGWSSDGCEVRLLLTFFFFITILDFLQTESFANDK